jgi:hypothetical protein
MEYIDTGLSVQAIFHGHDYATRAKPQMFTWISGLGAVHGIE